MELLSKGVKWLVWGGVELAPVLGFEEWGMLGVESQALNYCIE